MCRIHDCAIRVANSDRVISDTFIGNVSCYSAEVGGAAAICNGSSGWRDNSGGTYMSGRKTSATGSV